MELRTGHPERLRSLVRLSQDQFEDLLDILTREYGLKHMRSASAALQLAIFLFVVGQNASFRIARECFGHGTSSIS